jgi:hypothetical protein
MNVPIIPKSIILTIKSSFNKGSINFGKKVTKTKTEKITNQKINSLFEIFLFFQCKNKE